MTKSTIYYTTVAIYKYFEQTLLFFLAAQTGGDPQQSSRVAALSNEVDKISEDQDKSKGEVSSMKLSLIVMVVWVVIVTVALVVIGILSFRKWRRDYFMDAQSTTTGSESHSSAGDYSDMGSSLNVMMETASTTSGSQDPGGEFNSGFQPDRAPSPASVSVNLEDSNSLPNVDSNLSSSTTSLDVHVPHEPAAPTTSVRL